MPARVLSGLRGIPFEEQRHSIVRFRAGSGLIEAIIAARAVGRRVRYTARREEAA